MWGAARARDLAKMRWWAASERALPAQIRPAAHEKRDEDLKLGGAAPYPACEGFQI
jgi:hypothetical protein